MKRKNGFSMIELLITMAITAVLLTLGIVGITLLQKTSRDNARGTTLGEMANLINDYRKSNLRIPSREDVLIQNNKFEIIDYKVYPLEGHLSPAINTSNSNTKYFYQDVGNNDFILCALLESESIKSVGTSPCPALSEWN